MKWLAKLALISMAFGGSALAGSINIGETLVSGEVATYENRQETSRRELSAEQIQALSHWLDLHRENWSGMLTEASSEPSNLQLKLKDSTGKASSIAVVLQANGNRYLLLISSDKWSYRSFGGLFKSWAATRSLSDSEFEALQKMLGVI